MNDTVLLRAPDERAVRADLGSSRFQLGLERRKWRIISFDWPISVMAVAANTHEYHCQELALRFDLTGYPQRAPTAGPWDVDASTLLGADRRPSGEHVGQVFRSDWEGGRALYAPWDRVALEGHADWAQQYAMAAWNPKRDLAFYLNNVYDLINDTDAKP